MVSIDWWRAQMRFDVFVYTFLVGSFILILVLGQLSVERSLFIDRFRFRFDSIWLIVGELFALHKSNRVLMEHENKEKNTKISKEKTKERESAQEEG